MARAVRPVAQRSRRGRTSIPDAAGRPAGTGQAGPQADRPLVGVASYNRDSGPHRGKRTVWGGRSRVRAARYMGAVVASRWNPVIRDFYQRLLVTGEPKKLALTECMRKLLTTLNSMMRTGERWDTTIERLDIQDSC